MERGGADEKLDAPPVITNRRNQGGRSDFRDYSPAPTLGVTNESSRRWLAIPACWVHSHARVSGFHFLLSICPFNMGSNSSEAKLHAWSND